MSALVDLTDWMDEQSLPGILWYAKRLAANDTLATGSHQAGPYIPRHVLLNVFPSLNQPEVRNPDKRFDLMIDSHSSSCNARAVWYNGKVRQDETTRNEMRVTNLGGAKSPLLDPESTGSLAVFAFHRDQSGEAHTCHVWVCDHELEADLIEDRIGPVEPGEYRVWSIDDYGDIQPASRSERSCWLERHQLPEEWLRSFPSGEEIIRKTVELRSGHGLDVDVRLMKRRACEYEIFRSVEQACELPLITAGFGSIDDFITRAQTILQRRKSRSGRSLELHTRNIFVEENLREGVDFQYQPESEKGKKPDFLFPNEAAYKNPDFPAHKLRLLAAKTTCKDRWEQVINEGSRIREKHLLTLQEGISESQFRKMCEAGVKLVVPKPVIASYPESVQPHLQTLESFIADVRLLTVS